MTSTNRRRSQSHPSSYSSAGTTAVANHFDVVRSEQPGVEGGNQVENTAHDGMENPIATFRYAQTAQALPVPLWQRELANSRVNRHSRASSIISTRTRLTHQSDDARSIEFEAGGQSFRISRDGARVLNMTAPPPYPGPPLGQVAEESDEEENLDLARHSNDTVVEGFYGNQNHAELVEVDLPVRTHIPPGALQGEEPQNLERRTAVLELPQRLKSVFGLRWYGAGPPASNAESLPVTTSTMSVLRRTQSDSSSLGNSGPSHLRSLYEHGEASPMVMPDTERQMQDTGWPEAIAFSDQYDEQASEISQSYTRIVRDIDREHRKKLHERDELLAHMRELLDDKDKVYRQQLRERDYAIESLKEQVRFKDRTINELKTRNYEMEENVETRLENARNMVEEDWMVRWKQYEMLLKERLSQEDVGTVTSIKSAQ